MQCQNHVSPVIHRVALPIKFGPAAATVLLRVTDDRVATGRGNSWRLKDESAPRLDTECGLHYACHGCRLGTKAKTGSVTFREQSGKTEYRAMAMQVGPSGRTGD